MRDQPGQVHTATGDQRQRGRIRASFGAPCNRQPLATGAPAENDVRSSAGMPTSTRVPRTDHLDGGLDRLIFAGGLQHNIGSQASQSGAGGGALAPPSAAITSSAHLRQRRVAKGARPDP